MGATIEYGQLMDRVVVEELERVAKQNTEEGDFSGEAKL